MKQIIIKIKPIILVLLLCCSTCPTTSLAKKNKLTKQEKKKLLLKALSKKEPSIIQQIASLPKFALKQALILVSSTILGIGTTWIINKELINDIVLLKNYEDQCENKNGNNLLEQCLKEFRKQWRKEEIKHRHDPETIEVEFYTALIELIVFTLAYDIILNIIFSSNNNKTDDDTKQKAAIALIKMQEEEDDEDNN
ncbi:hypothetical protein GF322_03395 [Candidatus Dependentiae bacterium]|nr:hypothetical protein [Candidatus Dependentiae bacterium]